MNLRIFLTLTVLIYAPAVSHAGSSIYASNVISYTAGTGIPVNFDDPTRALGKPTVDTTFGDVTTFNSPFLPSQLVSVGDGGELVVSFNRRVRDYAKNPFGIDLIVFGNAFFFDPSFAPIATGIFAETGLVSVSQDGSNWFDISMNTVDGLFPTLGYQDTSSAFNSDGTIESNFRKAVDPSIDWQGKNHDELVALYDGSGGGAGIDISETGLPWIEYVRIQSNGLSTPEIDAFSRVAPVPEPSSVLLFALGSLVVGYSVRRRAS